MEGERKNERGKQSQSEKKGEKSCPGQLQEFNSIVFDWHEYDLKLERK